MSGVVLLPELCRWTGPLWVTAPNVRVGQRFRPHPRVSVSPVSRFKMARYLSFRPTRNTGEIR